MAYSDKKKKKSILDDRGTYNFEGWDQASEGWLANCLNENEMQCNVDESEMRFNLNQSEVHCSRNEMSVSFSSFTFVMYVLAILLLALMSGCAFCRDDCVVTDNQVDASGR